ncbi:hypothetical protein N2152v2_004467 [Parachlorella kessleri]
MWQLWPALGLLSQLRRLQLYQKKYGDPLDALRLASLPPSLARLEVTVLDELHIVGTGLLPSLTSLVVSSTAGLVIDAPLVSLRELRLFFVRGAQLRGSQLQLPQLTLLHLSDAGHQIDLQRMPSLRCISFWGSSPTVLPGLAALSHVTSLVFQVLSDDHLVEVLECTLAHLCHLGLHIPHRREGIPCEQRSLVSVLQRSTQLTSLTIHDTGLLPHLTAVPRLRSLVCEELSAAELDIEDLNSLAGLKHLTELVFSEAVPDRDERAKCLQLLTRVLPDGCKITLP